MGKIIFCQMAMNRLHETKQCLTRYLPYVDEIILVDGGSSDDSIFYFRNWAREEPKIHFYLHPWVDNFPAQRTLYLRHADEFAKPGDYILVSDPDELFEDKLLSNLQQLINHMDNSVFNVATFQSRSVSLRGDKRVHENLDDYWKHLFYKWEPNMHYVGNPHETMIIPSGFRQLRTPFIYEHLKQEDVVWHRGARNFVVWGNKRTSIASHEMRKMEVWNEFSNVCKENGIPVSWHAFDKYLMKGSISNELKDWMIKYKDIDKQENFEFASEVAEVYRLYFEIYHPQEKYEIL